MRPSRRRRQANRPRPTPWPSAPDPHHAHHLATAGQGRHTAAQPPTQPHHATTPPTRPARQGRHTAAPARPQAPPGHLAQHTTTRHATRPRARQVDAPAGRALRRPGVTCDRAGQPSEGAERAAAGVGVGWASYRQGRRRVGARPDGHRHGGATAPCVPGQRPGPHHRICILYFRVQRGAWRLRLHRALCRRSGSSGLLEDACLGDGWWMDRPLGVGWVCWTTRVFGPGIAGFHPACCWWGMHLVSVSSPNQGPSSTHRGVSVAVGRCKFRCACPAVAVTRIPARWGRLVRLAGVMIARCGPGQVGCCGLDVEKAQARAGPNLGDRAVIMSGGPSVAGRTFLASARLPCAGKMLLHRFIRHVRCWMP